MLHHLLTGAPPFPGDDPGAWRKAVDTNESMFMSESTFGPLSELPPDAATGKQ